MQEARGAISYRDLTLAEFVGRLSSAGPVPGGGSAAAVAAGLGAALVAMVASLSIGRAKYVRYATTLERALTTGRRLTTRFLDLADADADAYGAFAAARKRPRDTAALRAARARELAAGARRAAQVPLDMIEACLELAEAAESMAGRSNADASSDLAVAALFAEASAQAAAANVLVNLKAVDDPDWAVETTARLVELLAGVDTLASITREIVGSGECRDPIPAESEG